MVEGLAEAKLYRKLGDGVVCQLCWRFCRIREGEAGFCGVRVVKEGKLQTLTYGNLSHLESRPIEIKPFFHFLPGSTSATFSSYSCNLECPWCQNWRISRALPTETRKIPPSRVVEFAIRHGDKSTCASLNEPTLLFEYLLDLFPLAKQAGLRNTMVSNGYMTLLALRELKNAGLDAINIDVKGDNKAYELIGGKVENVWKVIREAEKLGLHLEIVCLLVSGVSDDEEIVRAIVQKLAEINPEIPVHFTRYFPAFLFRNPPTAIEKLERAVEIARKELSYAYIGNVPGHEYENTYCPECGELLIERYHLSVLKFKVSQGCCYKCGREIYGVWR